MDLRTAVATVLDSSWEIRGTDFHFSPENLETGETLQTVTGRLQYEECSKILRAIANRLIQAEFRAEEDAMKDAHKRMRAALMSEFDLKAD